MAGGQTMASPPGREPRLQELGAFRFLDPRFHGNLMVEPGIGAEVVQRTARARLGVGGPEHQPAQPGGHRRAGAHRARFERDVQGGVVQSPRSGLGRGLAQGQDLGVAGRVAGGLSLVAGGRDHPIPADHDRSDRHLAGVARSPGLLECQLHRRPVVHGRHRSAGSRATKPTPI